MKGEKYRGPRYVVTNDTAKYASESLFKDIVKEINTHLKYKCKIDADFVSSEWGSWVLAPTTNLCNSRHGGGILRVADFVLKNVPFLSFVRLKNAPFLSFLRLKNAPFACSRMPLFIFYLFSGVEY
jgi:hypothetical protein